MTQENNKVYKEVYTILTFFDTNLINKIPDDFFIKISQLAAKSNYNFYVDSTKSLMEQEISQESKDLLSYIYYQFVAKDYEKQELLKIWEANEKDYKKFLEDTYDFEKIVQKKSITSSNDSALNDKMLIKESKKNNFLSAIKKFLKNFFK